MSSQFTYLVLIILIHSSYSHIKESNENTQIPEVESPQKEIEDNDNSPGIANTMQMTRNHHKRQRDPVEVSSSRLKLFEHTDADGDGFVTKHEYKAYNGIHENTTDVEDLFMMYDRDIDGRLSQQEFVEQSSPWDVINECEFWVMQICNAELDQSITEADNDLDEPLCRGLQSYLNCVTSAERSGGRCDIESYIASVKQTALIYRSSGLCPNLDIGKLDFDIEIDYEPRDEVTEESEYEESEYSSDSEGSKRRHVRSLENRDEDKNSEKQDFNNLEHSIENVHERACTLYALEPCNNEFEEGLNENMDTNLNFEKYRECVLRMIDSCGPEKESLLLRESLKLVAQKHIAIFYNDITREPVKNP